MEHCEERMISLAKELGLDEEKEQAFFAVIKCFANAIELVNDEIKEFGIHLTAKNHIKYMLVVEQVQKQVKLQ